MGQSYNSHSSLYRTPIIEISVCAYWGRGGDCTRPCRWIVRCSCSLRRASPRYSCVRAASCRPHTSRCTPATTTTPSRSRPLQHGPERCSIAPASHQHRTSIAPASHQHRTRYPQSTGFLRSSSSSSSSSSNNSSSSSMVERRVNRSSLRTIPPECWRFVQQHAHYSRVMRPYCTSCVSLSLTWAVLGAAGNRFYHLSVAALTPVPGLGTGAVACHGASLTGLWAEAPRVPHAPHSIHCHTTAPQLLRVVPRYTG